MSGSIKISARKLWKLFGDDPAGFLKGHKAAAPTADEVRAGGYIGAVQDVSFDVREGEILIIMGLSGCGKSTLIRCLARLTEPTSGAIHFDGEDLLRADTGRLIELRRHKMGMVFQHFGLLPHRNVLSNVAFPLEVQGVSREKREARAAEIIRLVGLGGRETYFPRDLSGGQQQRVGIARSLAVEPDVWFLDEPFSALDPLIRREMQDEFLRLQRMLKKTIVFITHDFDEAIRLADRIGIMKEGRLVQLCTPEEMVMNPATDYVSEFTRNAPIDRIVSVRSLMQPLPGTILARNGVSAAAKIADVAPLVLASDSPLPVVDIDGSVIGVVSRENIITSLFRRRVA